jgi:hypothetical protein
MTESGYQHVDLDHPAVFERYLNYEGHRVPIFPLIGVLYSFAPPRIYPSRVAVGIPEFAMDFGFDLPTVERLFDCVPETSANAVVLSAATQTVWRAVTATHAPSSGPLPDSPTVSELNTGVGAEIAVASQLRERGWTIEYFGNQPGSGYDLRATRGSESFLVEVKSSIGPCTPELTEVEWRAARHYGPDYVVAIVDYFGTPSSLIRYLRDPAANADVMPIQQMAYRLPRSGFSALTVDADFL